MSADREAMYLSLVELLDAVSKLAERGIQSVVLQSRPMEIGERMSYLKSLDSAEEEERDCFNASKVPYVLRGPQKNKIPWIP